MSFEESLIINGYVQQSKSSSKMLNNCYERVICKDGYVVHLELSNNFNTAIFIVENAFGKTLFTRIKDVPKAVFCKSTEQFERFNSWTESLINKMLPTS